MIIRPAVASNLALLHPVIERPFPIPLDPPYAMVVLAKALAVRNELR